MVRSDVGANSEESCRLLLVEDSRGDAMVVQALIAEAGRRTGTRFHVDHVESYAAALKRLGEASRPYDAALLDLGLPDSDGIGTVGELSARYPGLALVVMTALDDADAAMDAVSSGAQEFLSKGKVRPEELARVLRHAILRRRMEQTLRESETEHRALFEFNPLPSWVCDLDSLRVLAANAAAVRQYGWSADQFQGMRFSDLTPVEELGALLDALQGDPGALAERVWRHTTRSGAEVLVQLAMHPLDFYSQPALLLMARNVNESARLAHALALSERRFDTLFLISPGQLFEHDLDGCILRANTAFAERLGYLPETLLGLRLQQLVPAYALDGVQRYLEALRLHGSFAGALPLMGSDQRRRVLRLQGERFDDPTGISRVLVLAEDAG